VLPIWLYCDDTSGNISKKWNEHNSILMSLAGLPSSRSNLRFEIHFLSTSNLAPPAEMFEGLSDEIRCVVPDFNIINYALVDFVYHAGRRLQVDGFAVFDCVEGTEVLFIPWVYAFQGNNPMASEAASHIGLNGILFCRVCRAHSINLRNIVEIDHILDGAEKFMQVCLCDWSQSVRLTASDSHFRKELYAQKPRHWNICRLSLILHHMDIQQSWPTYSTTRVSKIDV